MLVVHEAPSRFTAPARFSFAGFHAAVAHERAISKSIGGRTVLDHRRAAPGRLTLPL